jgi:glucosylceramidase
MASSTRRAFLKRTAALSASLICAENTAVGFAGAVAVSNPRAWVTDDRRKYEPLAVSPWQSNPAAGAFTIRIDAARKFQSILGFGGAFTEASCYLFHGMDPAGRRRLLEELFGRDGLRLSVGRTAIGSSDYSRTAYSYDDAREPDPDLKQFSIDHDRACILPILRDAQKANPEMFFFASPWSPPGWMKTGGSLLGGSMRKRYFRSYADYFVKFLECYKAGGVNISAVTTQNEVDTDQDGRMPATLWGQEYESGFIKEFLGPAIRQSSSDTKIWLLDHNYNLWGRVMDELSDPDLAQYVDGVAWHGYMGTPDAMTRVHEAFPDKHAYSTEGGPDITAPDYATDWVKWSGAYAGILKNWARCIVTWNLLLDENGQPNIGPFQCGGLVTLNSKTGQLLRSGQYLALAHYSRAIRRGARVIATEGNPSGVEHVALENPDGSRVLVLTNRGAKQEISCQSEEGFLTVRLPSNSVITLQWG